ncbi:DMT family transporter [Salinisphaera sp. S4-8]|uniref:DMT family transporter n=1 Tax=Salinisphaera sp. S4-8 TaxID=633357 RepID=UPI00333E9CE5
MRDLQAVPNRAVTLVVLIGAAVCLGMTTTLAKLAGNHAVAPAGFVFWSLAGATLVLLIHAVRNGQRPKVSLRHLEYYLIAGLVSAAGPNLIFFSAIPVVGAAYVSFILSLPPLLTYLGALALGMERFDAWRFSAVLAALTGTGWLAAGQLGTPNMPAFWIVFPILGPVLLSIGNLYRSLRWPAGASPVALTPGMTGAAVLLIGLAGSGQSRFQLAIALDTKTVVLLCAQAALFAAQFLLLFILQRRGGPVFLSLLGGVAAIFAVPVAIFLLGEPRPQHMLPSVVGIATGVIILAARRAQSRPA